jgi:ATP/maltotriose-dependent transcriptional regulator MalT/DNA-binding SARP family transcriptional activator
MKPGKAELPVIKTKVLPPRRPAHLLRRPRLMEVLDQLFTRRLALIVAPAGYGKTSLLVDWASNLSERICWFTVDILDKDPYRFISGWIAAIAQPFPDFGIQSTVLLQAFVSGQATLDQLLTTMVNELYDTVEENFVLIVDDYHLVDGVADIDYFLSRFVQNVGPNCHIVLASRKLLALPNLALFVARSQVAGIDYEDLAFTSEEVQDLVQRRFGRTVSLEEAAALAETTEGWITGLLLTAHGPAGRKRSRRRLTHSAGVDLYDYLAQEVLDQQPEDLRRFLLRTAALEEFDAEMCSAIFDEGWLPAGKTWDSLVDEVFSKGLFVLAVGEDGEWVRFHRLFQEFMLYRLHQEYPEDEETILRRLAAWRVDRRQWERAYYLYQRLQDEAAIAALIVAAGPQLIHAGRAQLVDQWTKAFPAAVLHQHNELLAVRGVALVQIGQVTNGLTLLNQAIDSAEDETTLAYGRALGWRAIVFRLLGQYDESIAESRRVIPMAPTEGNATGEDAREWMEIDALSRKNIGLCYYWQGRLDEALDALERALALYNAIDDELGAATVRMDIAAVYGSGGALTRAQANFEMAAETWRQWGHLQRLALTMNNIGMLFHRRGELVRALEAFAAALNHAQYIGHQRIESLTYASIGDLLVDLEYWAGARKAYDTCYAIASELNAEFLLLYADLQRSWLTCLAFEPAYSFQFLDRASKHALAKHSDFELSLYQSTMGRYYLLIGQASKAVETLGDAFRQFTADNYVIEATITRLWLAAAYQATGADPQAQDEFSAALVQLFEMESSYPVVIAAKPIVDLLKSIPPKGQRSKPFEQFFALVERWRLSQMAQRRQVRHSGTQDLADFIDANPPLYIRALGRTETVFYGQLISNSDWKTLVSRDILYCLAAHPDGLSREEIGVLFWPDASPGKLKTRFKNAIYRLRSALGPDIVVYEDGIYRFNWMLDYEYDVESFLDNVDRARLADDAADKIPALERAVRLYYGPYCPEIEDDWARIEREKLDRVYRDALLLLGEIHFDQGDHQQALDDCRLMLAHDVCWEEAHRLAMRTHAALGNQAEIVRQFSRCREALHREIDVDPSPLTEELFDRLMG